MINLKISLRVSALFTIALGIAHMGVAPLAWAQEDQIEAAIAQSRSGESVRALQAQANAEAPKTDDPHELAIFYNKRVSANDRLGNYARAIDDLRLA
jgi:hypothetical protein